MEISNWIDEKIDSITNSKGFLKYFKDTEIEQIEDSFYIESKKNGIELVLSKEKLLTTIHIYSGDFKDFNRFLDKLPKDLAFNMSRERTRQLLGDPQRVGAGGTNVFFGSIPPWDKYFFETYSLHLQFTADGSKIDMISIGSLKLEDYFNIGLQ